jgi:hypothetical protein
MDRRKCDHLKATLSTQAEPWIVPIETFFDGNDDKASIGCNLIRHPGMDAFRNILLGVAARPDVVAVYAQVSEVDPGEEYWPFADTVLVVGPIRADELANALAPLEPDDVGPPTRGVPKAIARQHDAPVLIAWWD